MELLKSSLHHGGEIKRFRHASTTTGLPMIFSVFLPAEAVAGTKVPAIYFLAGLECTDETFAIKAGAFAFAARAGVAIVCPDTSPRGANVVGESDSWDFGVGAGFYVDATAAPWRTHWRMYSYVTAELPALVNAHLPIDGERISVMGHSMGGLGALLCALRNPGVYRAVTAFAPISNPTECPWGQKAFAGYLGCDRAAWAAYDPTSLIATYAGPDLHITIEQGTADGFYEKKQLLPENFITAAAAAKVPVNVQWRQGYDHSYWFISTFIGAAVDAHARWLKA